MLVFGTLKDMWSINVVEVSLILVGSVILGMKF